MPYPEHRGAGAAASSARARQGRKPRVGDWMEVRPLAEILATLDGQMSLEGLPFMPEMARFCGQRFQVYKSAHKTCDPTGCTNMRRMENAVHLRLRCDGSGHDGCEAACLIFWKTAWLKPAERPSAEASPQEPAPADMARLLAAARSSPPGAPEIRYRCQATEIVRATTEQPSHQLSAYAEDLRSGNIAPFTFLRHFSTVGAKSLASKFAKRMRFARRRKSPEPAAVVAAAREILPGEVVRVRPGEEIAATLDGQGKNRGLRFEEEMLRHCGRSYRVQGRVRQIIDEATGRKIRLGGDCIVLEGVQCDGTANSGRLFCSRSPYYYWRAAWLAGKEPSPSPAGDSRPTPVCSTL